MGKIEEKEDGYYVLDVNIGNMKVRKAFKDSDKNLKEISDKPKKDGFYLHIADIGSDEKLK